MRNYTAFYKGHRKKLMNYYREKTYITRDALKSQFRWSESIIDYFLPEPDKMTKTKTGRDRPLYMFLRVEAAINRSDFETKMREDVSQRIVKAKTVKKKWHDERQLLKKESGICSKCTKSIISNSSRYCEKHHFRIIAANAVKDESKWQEVKQILVDQNYRCALTGDEIIVGINDSVDHAIPKSKFYDTSKNSECNSLENIRSVTRKANTVKTSLTDAELMAFLSKISNHRFGKLNEIVTAVKEDVTNREARVVLEDIRYTKISEIKMSLRLRRAILSGMGDIGVAIYKDSSVIDLCKISATRMLKMRDVGKTTLRELINICKNHGNMNILP